MAVEGWSSGCGMPFSLKLLEDEEGDPLLQWQVQIGFEAEALDSEGMVVVQQQQDVPLGPQEGCGPSAGEVEVRDEVSISRMLIFSLLNVARFSPSWSESGAESESVELRTSSMWPCLGGGGVLVVEWKAARMLFCSVVKVSSQVMYALILTSMSWPAC